MPPADGATLTGHSFFPHLISAPFHTGLIVVSAMATAMSVIGALASLLRGGRYVHLEDAAADRQVRAVAA